MEHRAIQKVFVRAPNWLGDVVMATPAFARIRSMYMQAEIVCGIKPSLRAVLSGQKAFDRFFDWTRVRSPLDLWRRTRALRAERFDLAIVLTHSLSSLLPVWLAGIPERVGYLHDGRSLFLTRGLYARKERLQRQWGPKRLPVPMVEYYFQLLDLLGMPRVGPAPLLRVSADEEARAAQRLAQLGVAPGERYFVVNVGAAFGSSKLWPTERFAETAARLSQRTGARGVLLAGPGEEPLVLAVAAQARVPLLPAIDPVFPLDVLKAVIKNALLMLTGDTGPRHLAVAFQVPVVVLMGPTDPRYTAANLERTRVVRHDVPCGPCHLKVCPLDHACMQQVTVDEAVAAACALLDRPA